MTQHVPWPNGKQFAFTIHDDTDGQSVDNVGRVYSFLADCGFRTTKSCWSFRGDVDCGMHPGQTLDDPEYCRWLKELESKDFGVDWHGASWHSSERERIIAGLERFAEVFQHYPVLATNHASNEDAIYWGSARLTGLCRFFYNVLTRYHNHGKYRGHIQGDKYFWGDICREKVKYYRNFIFQDINTLKACPCMPYHDPRRPYVNYWFASSNGTNVDAFNRCLSEENQDRLEAEGGACIMYAHFASGFSDGRGINRRFEQLMRRLAQKNGWYVRCAVLLDHLLAVKGHCELTDAQRRRLEWKWLLEKLFVGHT
jgi:hypothetical protein